MNEKLSVAVGSVYSLLDFISKQSDVLENVTHVLVIDNPTNIIEFDLDGEKYEILVTAKKSHRAPSNGMVRMQTKKMGAKELQPSS